ncbi:MAG: RtcB family protein [Deltaproteobacteria bacterium]|nr:RtcB family protein [Deltaproteobacteria bacterium]
MSEQKFTGTVERIDANRVRVPKQGAMRVDGIVYADEILYEGLRGDMCLQQITNVATLPGILKASIGMPDIHWGYGFPIGGVAAFDLNEGVVSPGGVGYDINCGVRLLRSNLTHDEVKPELKTLVGALFHKVPSGVGSSGTFPRLSESDYKKLLVKGAAWPIEQGYGDSEDIKHLEAKGCIPDADPDLITLRAKKRGQDQLGTLGSGNHFLEIEYVAQVFDENTASQMGLFQNQICVSIHCGSRGLGHQTCEDNLGIMLKAAQKYGIELPDNQLCCAPVRSNEGKNYLAAMASAANFAFGNRQVIAHLVRRVFSHVFKKSDGELGMNVIYDVCHNIAKMEKHPINGKERMVCVHRKGATRAFPPGHPETPEAYQKTGQPVLIPGDMGRYSYVLVGTGQAFEEAFGSSCHGAGRLMSRTRALKGVRGRNVAREMEERGVIVQADSYRTLGEEIPEAYKDVAQVVRVVENAGLAKIVAQLKPIGVIKG